MDNQIVMYAKASQSDSGVFLVTTICLLLGGVVTALESDYSNQGLTQIPTDIPTDTEVLIIDDNDIPHVRSEDFLGLRKLYHIDLSRNELTVFPNLSSVAGTLIELWLARNYISSVPPLHLNILIIWKFSAFMRTWYHT